MKKLIIGISSAFLLGITAILGVVIGVNHSNNRGTNLSDLNNTDSVIFEDLQENGIRLRQNKITQTGGGVTITAEITPTSAIKPTLTWEFYTASGKSWKTEADDLIQGMDSWPTISQDTLTIEFYMYGYWTETIVLKCQVKDNPEINASINLECVGRDITTKELETVIVPETFSVETMTMTDFLGLFPEKWYNEKTTGGSVQGNACVSATPDYVEFMTYSWTEGISGEEEVYVFDCQTASWSNIKNMTIKEFVTQYIKNTNCPYIDTYEEALNYFAGQKTENNDKINFTFVYTAWAEYNGNTYSDDYNGNPYAWFMPKYDMTDLLSVSSITLGSSTLYF